MEESYYTKPVAELQPGEMFCHYGRNMVPRFVKKVTKGPSKVSQRIGDGPWHNPERVFVEFVGAVGFTGPGTFEYVPDHEMVCLKSDYHKMQTGWHLNAGSKEEGVDSLNMHFGMEQEEEGRKFLATWLAENPRQRFGWYGCCHC